MLPFLFAMIKFSCLAVNNAEAFLTLSRMRNIFYCIYTCVCVLSPLSFLIPAALKLPTRAYGLSFWIYFLITLMPILASFIVFGYRTITILNEVLTKRPTPDLMTVRFRLTVAIVICCLAGANSIVLCVLQLTVPIFQENNSLTVPSVSGIGQFCVSLALLVVNLHPIRPTPLPRVGTRKSKASIRPVVIPPSVRTSGTRD
jgi:hypothetical protein